jgi:hypothetical protein
MYYENRRFCANFCAETHIIIVNFLWIFNEANLCKQATYSIMGCAGCRPFVPSREVLVSRNLGICRFGLPYQARPNSLQAPLEGTMACTPGRFQYIMVSWFAEWACGFCTMFRSSRLKKTCPLCLVRDENKWKRKPYENHYV